MPNTMEQKPDEVTLRHLARVIESSDDAIVSKDLNEGRIEDYH